MQKVIPIALMKKPIVQFSMKKRTIIMTLLEITLTTFQKFYVLKGMDI